MPVALVTLQVLVICIVLLTIWIPQVPRPWDFPTRPTPAIKQSDDATSPSIPHVVANVPDISPDAPIESSKSPDVLAGPNETSPLA